MNIYTLFFKLKENEQRHRQRQKAGRNRCNVSICVHNGTKAKIVQSNRLFKTVRRLAPRIFCHHHNTHYTHIRIFFPASFFFSFMCTCVSSCNFRFCLLFWFERILQHGVMFVWCHATITKQIRFIGFDGALTLVCKWYAWGFRRRRRRRHMFVTE